ncbi:MAG: Obg family GTPase CgtA, partial [Bdellovibrionales bacterium]|nr:Obg family GTPase CgtA [Bdellovibrionales bacterium]
GGGEPGGGQNMSGADGADMILEVPPGTVVKSKSGEILMDLEKHPEGSYTFLKGGRGGKGNAFFKTSVNQAPAYSQPGEPNEVREVVLELKLLADVGIIGFPNAGKSTLISRISAAKPKIADYPFTTLSPNLGVVQIGEQPEVRSFVVADTPGLVPGAHSGTGLGNRFLKHIERTRSFIHLIDASELSGRDPWEDYSVINHELQAYDEQHHDDVVQPLSQRKQIVVLNKVEICSPDHLLEVREKFASKGVKTLEVSGATGQNLKTLIFEAARMVFGEQ